MAMDIWVNVIAASSGLLGAVIGIAGTLLSERWRGQAAAQTERHTAALRLREERKDVLIRFFALVREVERLAQKRLDGEDLDDAQVGELTSRLWLLHLEVHMICTQPMDEAANALTQRMITAAERSTGEELRNYLGDVRRAATAAARAELGVLPLPDHGGLRTA
jgi:hypothetical protein